MEERQTMTNPAQPTGAVPTVLKSQLLNEDPDLADVVEEFIEGLDDRIAEMRAAFKAADSASLATLAHRLRGAGGSYGYPELTTAGAEAERQWKQADLTNAEQWIGRIEELAKAARRGLPDAN